jgi:hypothetical protein
MRPRLKGYRREIIRWKWEEIGNRNGKIGGRIF